MHKEFSDLVLSARTPAEVQAAAIFAEEIEKRTNKRPDCIMREADNCVCFREDHALQSKDAYSIQLVDTVLTIRSRGIRGFLYGIGLFLRKTFYHKDRIQLVQSIDGYYSPDKTIRGHQLGYRVCSNTYDAWNAQQYRRYYLDMTYFGANTVELIPGLGSDKNALMDKEAPEFCIEASAIADELDMDVSLWIPNDDLSPEESTAVRRAFFEKCPRINAVFVPGGDPGQYSPDDFMDRVCMIAQALKSVQPNAQMWPSAQAPHSFPDWGEGFIRRMQAMPYEVDGVITGPNHALSLEELRRRLPKQYPIRFYPDITHNVRCEYPVHFTQDDWHFAFASTLSRECINPRADEFRLLHRLTSPYVVGSVCYSDGVNDDVNKMVWSAMDFDPSLPVLDILKDYARLFLWQGPSDTIADGILALERNWIGDPADNPQIEDTLRLFSKLADSFPSLLDNWRFVQLLFRAECDALVRMRRVYELEWIKQAKACLRLNDVEQAEMILRRPFPDEYNALRAQIDRHAFQLFQQIGMQLDISRFHASAWERGATLDTLDLPVTDREYYLNRIQFCKEMHQEEKEAFLHGLIFRNSVRSDETYFSVAEHGLVSLGMQQTPGFYMDFQGDDPAVNDGSIPTCQFVLYDHFCFQFRIAGCIPGIDYVLRVSYSAKTDASVTEHTVTVNGSQLYSGTQYGGEEDPVFDTSYLSPGTRSATYRIPASLLENGCAEIVIAEPKVGVKLSEFWVLRAEKNMGDT